MANVLRERDATILELEREYSSLDQFGLDALSRTLLTQASAAEPPRLILDLSRTTFVGSRVIELLVRVWKRVRQRGGKMVLCGAQPFCLEVLQTTHLDQLWPNYSTREEALRALASAEIQPV